MDVYNTKKRRETRVQRIGALVDRQFLRIPVR